MTLAGAAKRGSDESANQAVSPVLEIPVIVGLALLTLGILWWRWVGYQGHDQASYAEAALDWVHHFPPLGDTHWALRYPVVLPTAAMIAVMGPTNFALAAIDLLAYAAFLAVGYVAARHWFGWKAAALLTAVYVLLPQFPVQATYTNSDMLEMALVAASFWTLMLAREREGPVALMMTCGVLAGIGFLTRETALLLVVVYGLMFLFRPAMPRWRYLWIGVGFAVIAGAQLGYFAVRTGDPFYRNRISAIHDTVDRTASLAEAREAGRTLDNEGVLAANPVIAPLAAVFVSQKYGLLFYLAIPAYAILRAGQGLTRRQRSVIDCAGLGALVAFLFVALNAQILYVVPRYFMVPAALAAVPVAVLGARWLDAGRGRRAIAVLAGLGFAASSLGLLYLENTRPMIAEERIAEFAALSGSVVHVDRKTATELYYLLLNRGLLDRVTTAPPGKGSVVAAEAGIMSVCLRDRTCEWREALLPFVPRPDWKEIARFEPPKRSIASPLEALGLAKLIPPDIWRKIVQPGATAVIWRTPES